MSPGYMLLRVVCSQFVYMLGLIKSSEECQLFFFFSSFFFEIGLASNFLCSQYRRGWPWPSAFLTSIFLCLLKGMCNSLVMWGREGTQGIEHARQALCPRNYSSIIAFQPEWGAVAWLRVNPCWESSSEGLGTWLGHRELASKSPVLWRPTWTAWDPFSRKQKQQPHSPQIKTERSKWILKASDGPGSCLPFYALCLTCVGA